MKKKYSRILGVTLSLILVASLFGFATPVSASDVAWSSISNPGDELHEGLNLADVEVGPIEVTPDGNTIFAAVNVEGPAPVVMPPAAGGISGVGAPGTFTFGARPDVLTLLAGALGAVGTWTATPAVGVVAGSATIVATAFTATAGQTVILTGSGAATTGTFHLTAGSVTATIAQVGMGMPPTCTQHLAWALLQSVDGGHNWTATDLIENNGPITGIAISSNFATDGTMYVTGWSSTLASPAVFRSQDSGANFIELKAVPAETAAATATTVINSITMYPASPYPYIMVGTNTDVWVLQDAPFGVWLDQEINAVGAVNVLAVAFAPDFATTNFTWAVTAAGVVTCTNSPGAWGTLLANTGVLVAAVSADIGFPSDYNSTTAPYLFVGINSGAGNGGVWRVRGLPPPAASQAIPQLAAVDITSIAVSGSTSTATILAGLQNAAAINMSIDGGLTWIMPVTMSKQPTGAGVTYVVIPEAPDFATSGVAYVGTSDGLTAQSAFQATSDGGLSWNQVGLIDTGFAVINDIAVVSRDTIFMVSDNYSLWKTEDATARSPVWERILTSATVTIPGNVLANIALVGTSPNFLTDGVVYVTDNATGIMKARDGGGLFAPMGPPAGGAAAGNITTLHVVDAIFAFTGAAGQVFRTDDGGYSWIAAVTAPAGMGGNIVSIATSPNYATDGILLAAEANGFIYRSVDRGVIFELVPPPIVGTTLTAVAFEQTYTGAGHPGPATHGIYASGVVAATGQSVILRYYFVAVGWESIDATMPAGVGGGSVFSFSVTQGSIPIVMAANDLDGDVSVLGTTVSLPDAGDAVTMTAGALGAIVAITPLGGSTQTLTVGGAPVVSPVTLTANQTLVVTYATAGVVVGTSAINALATSPDGTLYGCNALAGAGVERSLNPTASIPSAFVTGPVEGVRSPVFERMNQQLTTHTLANLQLVVDETLAVTGSKNVLFAIDTTGLLNVARIVTYTDTLAAPIVLIGPEDEAMVRETEVQLSFEELTGAVFYVYQIAEDDLFTVGVLQDVWGYTGGTVPGLRAGVKYYWRVRADDLVPPYLGGQPILSRWSETRSFVTGLGERPWSPVLAPLQGVDNNLVPLKPSFHWTGADWATGYEFLLADNADLTSPLVSTTVNATAYACTVELKYSTAYFWQVRAVSGISDSEWSDVGTFTTMAEPVEATPPVVIQEVPDIIVEVPPVEVPPAVEATPTWALLVIIIIGAVLVVSVIVLILRTRRPI